MIMDLIYIELILYISFNLIYEKIIFNIPNYCGFYGFLHKKAINFLFHSVIVGNIFSLYRIKVRKILFRKVSIAIITYFHILYNIIYYIFSFSYPILFWRSPIYE